MSEKAKVRDDILEEIHRTRERIAEKFNYDIAAIVEDARKRQEASGWPIWQPAPKEEAPPAESKKAS